MNKFDSAVFLAALSLVIVTPGFSADTGGATRPNTDTDAVTPGAKAVDEVSGGAIVDPDRALERGSIKKKQPNKQLCKQPTTAQSSNPTEPPCEAPGKDGKTTPSQPN